MGLNLNVQVFRGGQPIGQHLFDSDSSRTIKIGRLHSAQIKLEDPTAARIHAVIEFSGSQVTIIDMGSTVGTVVNGAKIHKTVLTHGAQIAIGDTLLMIGLGGAVQAATTQAPFAAAPTGVVSPQAVPQSGFQPAVLGPAVTKQASISVPRSMNPGAPVAATNAASISMPSPVQPQFDGGRIQGGTVQRATRSRAFAAAVESKPHPALSPEPALTLGNRVLEVRSYWGEALLSVSHYRKPARITLGEAKGTDFFISSEGLPVEVFPFVRCHNDEYVLTVTDEMDGELEIDGQSRSFDTLRGSTLARKDPDLKGSYQIKLALHTRGLVHWGGATFALRFVSPSPPPPNKLFEGLDLAYINILVFSVFAHLAALVTLLVFPQTDALDIDLFDDNPDRFARIVLQGPEESKSTQDLLEKLKKQVEEKKEELRSLPEKKKNLLTKKPVKVRVKVTKQQKQQAIRQRFTKMFSGTSGSSGALLGGGGGGTLAGSLLNIIGTAGKGSASASLAGLGIRGSGPVTGGGIGTSRGIAGIGTSGRAGGGGLAYGSGIGIGKRVDRGMISLSTPIIMGALPKEVIQRVINQNKAQVRYCYERELQRNQNLGGRIMLKWIIAATGRVARVTVRETTMHSKAVENCIAAKIKGWKFPQPSGGGIVEVNYPFVFRAN